MNRSPVYHRPVLKLSAAAREWTAEPRGCRVARAEASERMSRRSRAMPKMPADHEITISPSFILRYHDGYHINQRIHDIATYGLCNCRGLSQAVYYIAALSIDHALHSVLYSIMQLARKVHSKQPSLSRRKFVIDLIH